MSRQIKTLEQLKDSRLLYEKKLPRFGYIMGYLVMGLIEDLWNWLRGR